MRAGDSREGIGPGMASPGDLSRYVLVDETVTVHGVTYDAEKIKALLVERHHQAEEIIQLRLRVNSLLERIRRADVHLRRRTSALTRVIAATRRDLRGQHF
jgi:hypothetical protein